MWVTETNKGNQIIQFYTLEEQDTECLSTSDCHGNEHNSVAHNLCD